LDLRSISGLMVNYMIKIVRIINENLSGFFI